MQTLAQGEGLSGHPLLAFALSVALAVGVFALLWKIRKSFGPRE